MKTSLLMNRFSIVCCWITLALRLPGGVPEPDTILYGKVVTRVGEAAYQLMDGDLRWTIASLVEGGKTHTFNVPLESLAGGLYSYRVNIPHELLAYDLVVADDAVPLTAGLQPLDHLEITVDGFPAVILPPAENYVGVQQATRGMTHEVNLEVQFSPLDSDGDGLPDWLEDRYGLDKWDPDDAPLFDLAGGTAPQTEEAITTFAQWCAFHFPGLTGDLALFAAQDSDDDGISNLEEYGFVLDPHTSEPAKQREQMLHSEVTDGYFSLSFRQRQAAADLSYVLEVSDDLQTWTAAEEVLQPVTSGQYGTVMLMEPTPAGERARHFARLKLVLSP